MGIYIAVWIIGIALVLTGIVAGIALRSVLKVKVQLGKSVKDISIISKDISSISKEKQEFYNEMRSEMATMSAGIENLCKTAQDRGEEENAKLEDRLGKMIAEKLKHSNELLFAKIEPMREAIGDNKEAIKDMQRKGG